MRSVCRLSKQWASGPACGLRQRPAAVSESEETGPLLSSATRSSLQALPRERSPMRPSPTMIAMVGWIFTSACTATTWAWTSITTRFPTSTHETARPIACCITKETRTFVETTEAAGLNVDNDRYSFACAWGESGSGGCPTFTWRTTSGAIICIATMATARSTQFQARPMLRMSARA